MHENPYHGLNFCQGTVAEMLDDPAREIFAVIRWFGERAKIFNVHFRNIKGRKLDFMEAFPDEGDMDMPKALAAYRDVGYPYMLMPDHVPQILLLLVSPALLAPTRARSRDCAKSSLPFIDRRRRQSNCKACITLPRETRYGARIDRYREGSSDAAARSAGSPWRKSRGKSERVAASGWAGGACSGVGGYRHQLVARRIAPTRTAGVLVARDAGRNRSRRRQVKV